MKDYSYTTGEENADKRLDMFLTNELDGLSRTQIQRLIEEGNVLVNDTKSRANYRLHSGDRVECKVPEPQPLEICAEDIPLDIVYEDQDVLVVNKPQGLVVHPANGNYQGTLVNALMYHCHDLSGINGVLRPGIVHRIDKDTSGLLLVAKNDLAHQSLAEQIKEHSVKREYLALVHGVMPEPGGIVEAPIGRDIKDRQKMAVVTKNSKDALTEYTVLERFNGYTLIECRLQTGRTHQIRVHMAYINHPVVGDPKYGLKRNNLGFPGQALHAMTIGFRHPRKQEWLEFSANPPRLFREVLVELGSRRDFGEEGS